MKEELIEFIVQNKGASTKKEEKMIISFINGLSLWVMETKEGKEGKEAKEGKKTNIKT